MQPQPLEGFRVIRTGRSRWIFLRAFRRSMEETLRPDFCSLDCVDIHFNVMSPSCLNLYAILTKLLLESSCVCSCSQIGWSTSYKTNKAIATIYDSLILLSSPLSFTDKIKTQPISDLEVFSQAMAVVILACVGLW